MALETTLGLTTFNRGRNEIPCYRRVVAESALKKIIYSNWRSCWVEEWRALDGWCGGDYI